VVRFLATVALAVALVAPVGVAIRPGAADGFTAVVTGPAPGDAAGAFAGSLVLNGSPEGVAVTGRAERVGGRLRLALPLKYADIPADWTDRFRLGTFDYRLRGTVAGRDPIEWAGTLPWNDVAVEGEKDAVSYFVRLSALELTRFSLLESEARASVVVRNPFSFPLKLAGASYTLFADEREVGAGETRGLLLHAGKDNTLDFPIEIDHGQLLSAAGSAIASGGEIDGRLRGQLRVRLPAGDVAVPLDLSGKFNLLAE
jgi:LEA14-like dessication related protein